MLFANVLQPLIDVADAILKFWHDSGGLGWGFSIVMMTVVVRLAILPLTFKGVKGMQELQRLQPEIKRLQERYKDDKQRMNQEMMRFYQEHKVNPLSSCLPLILQLPFFLALFYLLQGDQFKADIAGAESFFFIPNLAENATGADLVVLIVLYVTTMLGSTAVTAISADKTQQRIMLALPFIFIPFIITFPSGLLVYWITTNVWTVGQQLLVRKLYPKPDPIELKPDRDEPPAKRKAKAKASGNGAAEGEGARAGRASNGDGAGPRKPPPGSPRKKKKRSGRRR